MVTYSELLEFAMVLMTFANLGTQIAILILQVYIAKRNDRHAFPSKRSFCVK
jgi:hypothetical protein